MRRGTEGGDWMTKPTCGGGASRVQTGASDVTRAAVGGATAGPVRSAIPIRLSVAACRQRRICTARRRTAWPHRRLLP